MGAIILNEDEKSRLGRVSSSKETSTSNKGSIMSRSKNRRRRKKEQIDRVIIEHNLRSLDEEELVLKLEESLAEKEENKVSRDEENLKLREQLDARNEINRQVKELIGAVQLIKGKRDEANAMVTELKEKRLQLDSKLKIHKLPTNPDSEEMAELKLLKDKQSEAHKLVLEAAGEAQIAHNAMIEMSEEKDQLREAADKEQRSVKESSRIADEFHQNYFNASVMENAIKDTMKELKFATEKKQAEMGAAEREVEISELMRRIDVFGNVKLIEMTRSFYLEEMPQKLHWCLDELFLYVETAKIQHIETVRINLIPGRIRRIGILIGRGGAKIASVKMKLAELLNSDAGLFTIEILTVAEREKRGLKGDYSEFLLSHKLTQLRDFAIQLGLPKSGNKKDIVNRIASKNVRHKSS
jgi:uncharacterized coiled-coil DUF342 family protein